MTLETVTTAPFYVPSGNEIEMFEAAHRQSLPVMLKGPTGVGKTRFVEAMAYRLGRDLITVSCHEDLTSSDLVGRFLLEGDRTVWTDGPLTRAVRDGAICYLDEIVEARQDTTVVLHSLTDHRRVLPIDRLNVTLQAPPEFQLVVSYNPGYQSLLKDLKDSTRQRMVGIELGFPSEEVELEVCGRDGHPACGGTASGADGRRYPASRSIGPTRSGFHPDAGHCRPADGRGRRCAISRVGSPRRPLDR